jgi:hypothetical protein
MTATNITAAMDAGDRLTYDFCGLAALAAAHKLPLDFAADEADGGLKLAFSIGQMTAPGHPPPVAAAGQEVLRGVHWEIVGGLPGGERLQVMETRTLQYEGPVFRRGDPTARGQKNRQDELGRVMTAAELHQAFQDTALVLLPPRPRKKLAAVLAAG